MALVWVLIGLALASPAQAQDIVTVSGVITASADGVPVPGAVVTIVGATPTATTDAAGRYALAVPRSAIRGDRLQLRVTALGRPPKSVEVTVTGTAVTANIVLTLDFSTEVTVGSRVPGAAAEKSVPVDVISRDLIAASGFTETAQVIESAAASLNFPRPTITDGTDTVRPATLRGLGPDQVLVLVDGKRRHQSALVHLNNSIGRGSTGVDLNAIPVSAIDHIEILRDGAAAQYGSDAIAGVINIVLKSQAAGPQISVTSGLSMGAFPGNTCSADGRTCEIGSDISFRDGGLFDVAGNWGFAAGGGTVVVGAEYRHHNRTNRASFDPRDQIVAGDGGNNAVGQPNHRWGDPETRDLMTMASVNMAVNQSHTRFVYGTGSFSRREATSAGFYRRAVDARNWPSIYPQGFLPLIQPTVVDASGTAGVRGVMGQWAYDLSGGYGRNSFDFHIGNSLNVSLGPAVPPNKTEFEAGTLVLSQTIANVDVSRSLAVGGLAGPLHLALGAEVRREQYRIIAGEPDSYTNGGVANQFGDAPAVGAQVFAGFRPSNEVDTSRNNIAGYADVEGEVFRWLRLGGAVRGEHYSDFGGTLDGKVTARSAITSHIALRGSVSTGFRAPSLGQSFFSSSATNFLNLGDGLVPVESLTLPVDSAPAKVLGASPLKPEQSRHATAGIVFTPARAVAVAIDGYHIAIDDRIVLSGNFTAAPIAELLRPFNANAARFFTNAIDTRTNGVDVNASYRVTLADGSLDLRVGINHTVTRIVGQVATPPQLAEFSSVLFDRIEQRRIECGQPHDGLRLGGAWQRRRFAVNATLSRYGDVCSFTQNPADDQTYSAKWLTDAEVSSQVRAVRLAFGVQNLFDVFPDRNVGLNSFNGIQTFPSHSPFGMNGRTIYVRIGPTF